MSTFTWIIAVANNNTYAAATTQSGFASVVAPSSFKDND
ncbi:hypothetical protein OOU_Y34scaffold00857g3 [Pyricularia oryzae Y34]|uniref:Uncharacterized protein n=1 Tax=Pyricularia oryzae (strain Y34) TaxID=1143189 RepID=A0AA97NPG1_PYRO3|nr:hypothetical protein OOU_Y34scaffold00857g3 [Pyricularia oryzae Y34]